MNINWNSWPVSARFYEMCCFHVIGYWKLYKWLVKVCSTCLSLCTAYFFSHFHAFADFAPHIPNGFCLFRDPVYDHLHASSNSSFLVDTCSRKWSKIWWNDMLQPWSAEPKLMKGWLRKTSRCVSCAFPTIIMYAWDNHIWMILSVHDTFTSD